MATRFGRKVIRAEQEYFDRCAKDSFGYFAIQAGMAQVDALRSCPINSLAKVGRSPRCSVRALPSSMPFVSDSIDFAAVVHVLEFAADPHAVLREMARVLRPEGRLALSLFNPYSLVGLRSALDMTGEFPNHGRLIPLSKIKDWLSLLGFVLEEGECAVHGSAQRGKGDDALSWADHAGARWWPLAGSVMLLAARKRVHGMNILLPEWKRASPAARRLAVAGQNGA